MEMTHTVSEAPARVTTVRLYVSVAHTPRAAHGFSHAHDTVYVAKIVRVTREGRRTVLTTPFVLEASSDREEAVERAVAAYREYVRDSRRRDALRRATPTVSPRWKFQPFTQK